MSTPQVVRVAISPVVTSTPASYKRRVVPSAEAYASKRSLILTTPTKRPAKQGNQLSVERFYPKNLFLRHTANIVEEFVHGHAAPAREDENKAAWHVRHVLLPMNLRDPGTDIFHGEARDLLYSLFPGTQNVTEPPSMSYLLFQVKELPKKPWPLTIGGRPFVIADETQQGRVTLFPRLNLGNIQISICNGRFNAQAPMTNEILRQIAAETDKYFEKNIPKLEFIELMFTSDRNFYVVVADHADINSLRPLLPGKIAGCPAGYLRDHELHRPPWTDRKPKRPIAPQPVSGVVDRTAYDTLRPGVMISSSKLVEHGHPSELSTSSGVLVKDHHGNQFMTATSHGIGQNTTVFQTGRPERTIGKAAIDVAFTDIALVDLARDVVFENETFESNGTAPKFTRLAKSTDPVRMGHDCYLNSPYTGHLDGIIMMKSVKLETAMRFEAQKRYIIYDWAWMGQGGTRIPDGTCGSAIWDSDGVVLGFFHFYIEQGPWAGHAASVSASELEANESEGRAGWILAV
ncbi:hypothetical protein JX265_010687 [Neoarthrinium moseri]|uniref:Uncharacterized protein n=1 Tax=Neoarthrinium moseri TaxID=1658444 RepID=A0A9P9WDP5_9PEZI|nr:hypothetical protein JX265_010687 [Neoarthrinium moseri]